MKTNIVLKLNSTILNPSIFIQGFSLAPAYFNGSATCTVYIAAADTITANVPNSVAFNGDPTYKYNTLSFTRIC